MIVDDAPAAVLEAGGAEIDRQAERRTRQPQMARILLAMDRAQRFHGFRFHDQQVGDGQIDAQAVGETDPPAFEGDRLLPFDPQSRFRQGRGENRFMDRLQQARAKVPMQVERAIGDDRRWLIDIALRFAPFAASREIVGVSAGHLHLPAAVPARLAGAGAMRVASSALRRRCGGSVSSPARGAAQADIDGGEVEIGRAHV